MPASSGSVPGGWVGFGLLDAVDESALVESLEPLIAA